MSRLPSFSAYSHCCCLKTTVRYWRIDFCLYESFLWKMSFRIKWRSCLSSSLFSICCHVSVLMISGLTSTLFLHDGCVENVTSNNRQQCVLTLMWRFFLIPLFSCALPLQVEYEPGERVQETLRLWLTAAGGAEGRSSRSLSVSRVLWLRSYPRVCDKWHHRNFNFNPDKHLNSKYVNIFSLNETTTLKSPRSACRSFDADVK